MAQQAHQLFQPGQFVQGPNGEIITCEFITPEIALAILQDKNGNNRTMRSSTFDNYTKDMAEGRFMFTHQGIGFDRDEELADGQNRLQGIVNSGEGQWMLVTRGLDPMVRDYIDSGIPRPLQDRMVMVGHRWVSATTVATLRRMLASLTLANNRRMRASETNIALNKYQEALAFSEDCFRTTVRGITLAAVRAVVARAFYSADHDRVCAFGDILTTGMPTHDDDQAAILLRNNLLMTPSNSRGEGQMLSVYAKTERALIAFLRGESLSRLYGAKHELFPLPDELEAQKPRRKGRA